ncbi:GntR family transcriptional regulator [Paenibacillus mesophilus]|uniref:GntR family transcriptional regulator n=1 Tax=Paenibacillus mesophilus TaxID=2582849 RepID=UPI00110DE5CD|nr:GntR family transcriptional regulator [Paenibacillus mesophilus]TMV52260.1 GntR family transcriptional regulator [Paenibacillus mesophilus]
MSFQFKNQSNFSLRHRVGKEIRDAIVSGDLKAGDKLREFDIASQMGVSRGPVREALRDLEAMGLVSNHPYRETVVADVNKAEITELLIPIRIQLELFSIRTKLAEMDQAFFDILRETIAIMKKAAADNDISSLVEEDIRFHETIITYKETSFPKQIWYGIVNRLRIHFIKNMKLAPDLSRIPADHELLLEALIAQDLAKIEELWIHHISRRDSLLCFDDNTGSN